MADEWSVIGNALFIAGSSDDVALAALDENTVALLSEGDDLLKTFVFDGTDWAQAGSTLSIPAVNNHAMCAMSSTRVAVYNSAQETIGAYDWDGSSWATAGSLFSPVPGGAIGTITRMTDDRVAFIESASDLLTMYEFNGSSWSQVGSTSIGGTIHHGLLGMSATRVIELSSNLLTIYDFDGSNWSQVGDAFAIDHAFRYSLAKLTDTHFAISFAPGLHTIKMTGNVLELIGTEFSEDYKAATGLSPNRVAGLTNQPSLQFLTTVEYSGDTGGEEPPTGFWEKLSDHVVQGAS